MLSNSIHVTLRRELAAVRRSVEAYPDDASLWRVPGGAPNAGGTLVLHLAGNLQHYVGAVLGRSGYVRDREAEFSRRDVTRDALLAEIDATGEILERTMDALDDAALAAPYPERMGGRELRTCDFLVHLAAHLAYHLGQLDYHRRIVTGDRTSVNAVALAEVPAANDDA